MTIKKPMKAAEAAEQAPAATGGATIADRFKLDLTDPSAARPSAGKGTVVALVAGLLALAVAGVLVFVIYDHWKFLQAA